MSLSLALYLVDVLNSLGKFFTIFGIIATVVAAVSGGMSGLSAVDGDSSASARSSKCFKWAGSVASVLLITACLIPSTTTMYSMIGIEAAKTVLETPQAKEVTDKVLRIVNSKLDSLVKEATKE